MTSTLFLITAGIALALLVWRKTRQRPLQAAIVAIALVTTLVVASHHPFVAAAIVGLGVLYWRSPSFRERARMALDCLIVLTHRLATLRYELRWPRPTRLEQLEMRALRKIESNYRIGVNGERQIPTTARVLLNAGDYDDYAELIVEIERDLEQQLVTNARRHRLLARPSVHIVKDASIPRGRPAVQVSFAGETEDEPGKTTIPRDRTKIDPNPVLRRVGGTDVWRLSSATTIVGRVRPAEIIVKDDHVSRRHCRIECDGSGYYVTDMRSRNGTFVNGARIETSARLDVGDTLGLGRHIVLVFASAQATEAA